MMSGGKDIELKTPTFFVRPEAFQPAPLSEKVENGNGVTLDTLDVCEGDGFPPINNEYLSGVHRAVVLSRDEMNVNTAAATNDRFAEIHKDDPTFDENWDHAVAFYEPGDPPPSDTIPIDDALFKQITGATKYVRLRKMTGESGKLQWCRSEDGKNLWGYGENLILENPCTQTNTVLLKLPENLSYAERVRTLYLAKSTGLQICTKDGQLRIIADATVEEKVKQTTDMLGVSAASLADPKMQEKAEAIVLAFNDAMEPVHADEEKKKLGVEVTKAQLESTRNQGSYMPWMIGSAVAGVLVGGAGVYVAWTTKKFMVQQAGGKIDPNQFIQNNTTAAKGPDYSKIVLDPELEACLDDLEAATRKKKLPHVCLVGPSGSGKDLLAAHFEHRVAMGKVPHLEGRPIYRVDATDVMAEGGVFFGKFDQVVKALRKKVQKERSLARLSEVHILCDAPQGGSPQITKALTLLEDPKGSIFIFTSSQWDRIKSIVPDIDRRLTPIQMPAMTFGRVMNILQRTVSQFKLLEHEGIGTTQLEEGVYEAVAHFSKLRTGEEAAIAPETLDLLSAKAANRTDKKLNGITDDAEKQRIIAETNKITMKDILEHARNDALKENIVISEDQLRASLEFFRKFPDLEKPLFKTALRLISLGEQPELVFQGDAAEAIIHRAEQRMIAEKLRASGNGGGPPSTPSGGGEPPAAGTGTPPPPGGSETPPSGDSPASGVSSGEAQAHHPGITSPRDHAVEYWIANKSRLETEIGRPIGNDAIKFAAGAYVEPNNPRAVENIKEILLAVDDALKEKGYPNTTKMNVTHVSWGITKDKFRPMTDPFESAVKTQVAIEQGQVPEMHNLSKYPPQSIEHVKAFAEGMFSDFDDLPKAEKAAKLNRLVQIVERGLKFASASKHAALLPNAAASINDIGCVQTALWHIGHDEHMTFRPEYLKGLTSTAEVSHKLGNVVKNGGAEKPGKFGGSAAERVAVRGSSLERAVGPAMMGTMVGSTALEHYGVIDNEQKQGIDIGMLGGMTAAHPALLWELPVAGPLMAAGHEATQAGLEKVGVGRETLTSKLSGIGGAFATVEAAAYAAGRMAGETGSRALAFGHQIFQNAVRQELPRHLHELKSAVTTGVSTGIQNIRTGAQLYGSQIAASGTAAWAAAKSGAASAAMRMAGSPAAAVAARLVVQANAIFGLFMMPEQMDAARPDKTPGDL